MRLMIINSLRQTKVVTPLRFPPIQQGEISIQQALPGPRPKRISPPPKWMPAGLPRTWRVLLNPLAINH